METYKDFSPTLFDTRGLGCEDRQDWLVAPVGRNRDSGIRAESNFAVVLADLTRACDSGDFEVHRFGHWGTGWFEIILVRPDTRAAALAEEWESALADYPIACETDYSTREYEAACEAWAHADLRERIRYCAQDRVSIFAARRDEIPSGGIGEIYSRLAGSDD